MKALLTTLGAAALALSLSACGGSADAESEPAPTVTEKVEVTPQACIDALNRADEIFQISAEMVGAVQTLDVDYMNQLNAELDAHVDPYIAEKTECRGY